MANDFSIIIKNNKASSATSTSEQNLDTSHFFRTTKHFTATFRKFKRGAKNTEAQHSMREELVTAELVTG